MSFQFFLSLYIVLISFVIYNCADDSNIGSRTEDGLGTTVAVKAVAKIIASLFVGSATNCVVEAATQCKDYWKKPAAALDCAKNFAAANKGRCLISA